MRILSCVARQNPTDGPWQRKNGMDTIEYEKNYSEFYRIRALVAVLCITRIRDVQITLSAEGVPARSDNRCY
jgi:hypothetical protein